MLPRVGGSERRHWCLLGCRRGRCAEPRAAAALPRASAGASRWRRRASPIRGRPAGSTPGTSAACSTGSRCCRLDSVNVFCRSHYLPVFARLGPYPREVLDRMTAHTARPRSGAASCSSTGRTRRRCCRSNLQPLLRWRMARVRHTSRGPASGGSPGTTRTCSTTSWRWSPNAARSAPATPASRDRRRGPGQMWNWHDGKIALEYLFYAGQVTAARRVNFERYYDLHRAGAARPRCSRTPDARR